jgi:hypothetical protein
MKLTAQATAPNTFGRDKFYFDDVSGPSITSKSDVTTQAGTK